ncbi:MAG: tRNA uridine-5-carboxymethylaminomethyl(34) synthesis GTPase MnmE [Clostridia bacterium]|nr:tRNA uridine-5-carboxymethylaminomethyl(34) synthesis GTPase MnmE [Clostridia bacterium]
MSTVIAAIATPPAAAGIGVIRLSGEDAIAVADKVFRPLAGNKTLSAQAGYTALYGHVYDAEGDVDDCVALVFRAPHSYTGENVVELSCHGGLYLLRRCLRACIEAGAIPAEAGEFTKRAFLNGKMDLTGADAVMDLIGAGGALAARAALAAREGSIFRRTEQIKANLLAVAAQNAAYVDYPDDDIPELSPLVLDGTLAEAEEALSALLHTFDAGRMLQEGIDTVIVGTPNVGKSTLMNRLSGTERSIVTAQAGTTRDIVEDSVRVGDLVLRLSDTAGIRETDEEVEAIGIRRARDRMKGAALILAVFDGSRPLNSDDLALAAEVSGDHTVAILNKADQPPKADRRLLEQHISHIVPLSAKTGEGVDTLTAVIAEITGLAGLDENAGILTTERQRDGVRRALEAVKEAREALASGLAIDAAAVSIDAAIAALQELTGERASESVVNEVFARFCVGK